MARVEHSAGFVVFRDDARRGRVYLLLDSGRHWDHAKGHLKHDEDEMAAAKRELAEETGLRNIRVIEGFSHRINYSFYSKKKGQVDKTVTFFLAETASDQIILSDEHVDAGWFGYEDAMRRLTYETARAVLEAAHRFPAAGTSA